MDEKVNSLTFVIDGNQQFVNTAHGPLLPPSWQAKTDPWVRNTLIRAISAWQKMAESRAGARFQLLPITLIRTFFANVAHKFIYVPNLTANVHIY